MVGHESEQQLLQQAKAGDRVVLQGLLLEHYSRLARHVAPRLTGPLAEVVGPDDILQETFIQAIRDIDRCRADSKDAFFGWLCSIADNRVRDCRRRCARKKRGGDFQRARQHAASDASSMADLIDFLSDSGPSPDQSVARHEAAHAIQVGIAALPESQREAVRLRHLEGKSFAETAAEMDRTIPAVRGLLRRAKRALRITLETSSKWLSKK